MNCAKCFEQFCWLNQSPSLGLRATEYLSNISEFFFFEGLYSQKIVTKCLILTTKFCLLYFFQFFFFFFNSNVAATFLIALNSRVHDSDICKIVCKTASAFTLFIFCHYYKRSKLTLFTFAYFLVAICC